MGLPIRTVAAPWSRKVAEHYDTPAKGRMFDGIGGNVDTARTGGLLNGAGSTWQRNGFNNEYRPYADVG